MQGNNTNAGNDLNLPPHRRLPISFFHKLTYLRLVLTRRPMAQCSNAAKQAIKANEHQYLRILKLAIRCDTTNFVRVNWQVIKKP